MLKIKNNFGFQTYEEYHNEKVAASIEKMYSWDVRGCTHGQYVFYEVG
jgi:hypothetical protein